MIKYWCKGFSRSIFNFSPEALCHQPPNRTLIKFIGGFHFTRSLDALISAGDDEIDPSL